ncbi:MAG: DUF3089 domain-containing protein [Chitinophagaceae bacterium]|nr:MAG: DUF3089 domain-containing protein [Chitinophagaceae bacterium]
MAATRAHAEHHQEIKEWAAARRPFVLSSDMRRFFLLFFLLMHLLPVNAQTTDYSILTHWAAHPALHDHSDSLPRFLEAEPRDTIADIFFLHPTTFIGLSGAANASMNDAATNRNTDRRPILYQATIFNGLGRVFAPRYRQAHIRMFLQLRSPATAAAFDTAYSDLAAAFRYYLEHENRGRPIILAAHSQGSYHALRLLREFFDGTPLQKQLVCAYVVGWPIARDAFRHLPFGTSPEQTGCVVGWQSFGEDYGGFELKLQPTPPGFCVNPITWRADATRAGAEDHQGALGRSFHTLYPAQVRARIDTVLGVLRVTVPPGLSLGIVSGNLHVADFNLFWMDVRRNARLRIGEWQQKKRPPEGGLYP